MPRLGICEGVLEDVIKDVIKHAVTLPGFWQWGSGGDFQKVDIQKV